METLILASMNVTRKDISARSGVSVSTVGMVLNGHGERYTAETRRKVMEAAEALDYRPDISARGLRMKRSFLIGLSVFESNAGLMAKLIQGVQSGLELSEYSTMTFSHHSREEEIECHRRCSERKVDGMIVNPG